jgi:hypothetical protein
MLLFRSEEHIDRWCRRRGLKPGAILTPEQVWELSELWYHDRLSVDYHGRTSAQAEAIFQQSGLASEFWQAGPTSRPVDKKTNKQAD